jgi:hypothetical protein
MEDVVGQGTSHLSSPERLCRNSPLALRQAQDERLVIDF